MTMIPLHVIDPGSPLDRGLFLSITRAPRIPQRHLRCPPARDIRYAAQFANAQPGRGKMVARRADRARNSVRGVDLETRHTDNVDGQRGLAALEGQLPGLRV